MRWRRWLLLPLILALAAGLGYTVLSLPDQAQGLQGTVADQLEKSGVSNPVTAVLLNYRAYDTLLEMAVLLLAAVVIGLLMSTKLRPRMMAMPWTIAVHRFLGGLAARAKRPTMLTYALRESAPCPV